MLAALPFHHLIPAEKLASAFAAMPLSLVRPQTIGESERRRQFFWQSLAAAGVSAKEAALLDDSLHCHLTDSSAGRTIEVDWEVHYYDELQGSAEMYRAELLAFKRRIYEADDDLRGILELRADEFLGYLNMLNFNTDCAADSATDSNDHGVIETHQLERWFLDNLSGSFSVTVSELRNGNEKPLENKKIRKTKKIKAPSSDYTGYRTYEAKRIESWMFSDGDEDETALTGESVVGHTEMETVDEANTPVENEDVEKAGEMKSKDLNEPTNQSNEITAADPSLNVSTAVYRLQLADYWLDWQSAARTAKFDFDFLETLTDIRAMRFYELTKLWRLQSIAEPGADINDGEASDFIPDTLEIAYDQFASLMPLPHLRFEREVKEQLKDIITPLKASGYVRSFAVKTDWRGLNDASRLVFKFNHDFSAG